MVQKVVSAVLFILGLWFLIFSDASAHVWWGIILIIVGLVIWAAGGSLKMDRPSSSSEQSEE